MSVLEIGISSGLVSHIEYIPPLTFFYRQIWCTTHSTFSNNFKGLIDAANIPTLTTESKTMVQLTTNLAAETV